MSSPDECAAISTGCSYAPCGPAGEVQCRYCGAEPSVSDNLFEVLTTVHAIANTPADRYANDTEWALAIMRAAQKAVPAAQRLRRGYDKESEQLQRATDALRKVKLRLHFLGMPGESMWKVDNHFTWVPDWRYEIQLIEHVLHGSPITQPEKPTDTRKRIDVTFVTEQVDLQENGEPLYTRRAIATWPDWASKIFQPKKDMP